MGCSQSNQSVLLGLKEEIKLLQQKKSQIILELDSFKDQLQFFSMTEEEKSSLLRRLSSELSNLQIEFDRLQNLSSQTSGLSENIKKLDLDLIDKTERVEILEATCEKRKNEYLALVEQNNKIINESSDLSFEHTQKSKQVNNYSFAQQENDNLKEKIESLQENLKKLQETEEKINENQEKIQELEKKIAEISPLIQDQNEKHTFLLDIEDQLELLRQHLKSVSLTPSEQQYQTEIQKTLSKAQIKSEKYNQRLESLNNINIEDLKAQKESQMLIRQTLKSDLKSTITSANQQFIELCKLESKKSSLELISSKKVLELESVYQQACKKIQKKESEKIRLENELKEYQEILKELDFK